MPRRKPKAVTPVPRLAELDRDLREPDIPDDVMAALGADTRSETAIAVGAVESPADATDGPRSLEEISAELVPLGDVIRGSLADIALIPIARATPAQRTTLVNLRQDLDGIRRDLSTWVDAIDISFRYAAEEIQATEFPLTDGVVKIEQQRGEWVVNVPALRDELKEFVAAGQLTQHEFDGIFSTTVTEKANNTALNNLAKARGEELAAAINRSRTWKAGDPLAAKVRIQRGSAR